MNGNTWVGRLTAGCPLPLPLPSAHALLVNRNFRAVEVFMTPAFTSGE
jgi:hypothetical protein